MTEDGDNGGWRSFLRGVVLGPYLVWRDFMAAVSRAGDQAPRRPYFLVKRGLQIFLLYAVYRSLHDAAALVLVFALVSFIVAWDDREKHEDAERG